MDMSAHMEQAHIASCRLIAGEDGIMGAIGMKDHVYSLSCRVERRIYSAAQWR